MNGVGQRRGKEWTNSGNKNDEKKQMVEIKEERKETRRRRSAGIKGMILEVKENQRGGSSAERRKGDEGLKEEATGGNRRQL